MIPLMRANGVFETILVRDGCPVRLSAHLERMERSAGDLEIEMGDPFSEIHRRCSELAAGVSLGRMRVKAVGGRIEVGVDPLSPIDEELLETGAVARLSTARGHPLGDLAGHKVLPYDGLVAAREAARQGGAFEIVFVDRDGAYLEGAASNLFLVVDGVLLTPPLSRGILPGTTRKAVIEAARADGLEAREADLGADGAARAEEGFLTGSLMEVVPLRRLGPTPLTPGPVAKWARERISCA